MNLPKPASRARFHIFLHQYVLPGAVLKYLHRFCSLWHQIRQIPTSTERGHTSRQANDFRRTQSESIAQALQLETRPLAGWIEMHPRNGQLVFQVQVDRSHYDRMQIVVFHSTRGLASGGVRQRHRSDLPGLVVLSAVIIVIAITT